MAEARAAAERDGVAGGARRGPCWVSLMVRDPAAAREFYGALFGWEYEEGPRRLGPYARALLDGRPVAGLGQLPAGTGLPVAWTTYFGTEDVNELAATVHACGGTVGVGPLDSPGAGRLALVTDTGGAAFGLWQPTAHAGFAVTGVPGAHSWSELLTRDTASVAPFYRAALGFGTRQEGPGQVTFTLDGRPVAAALGVGRARARERGAGWLACFEVADVAASCAAAVRLGGQVVEEPATGLRGPTATMADPEGAVFALVRTDVARA
ncbi:VOC family protein [Streptomyces sp. SPB074]|uniref:VOC family protein n=1 Tax=Streptomyces sp. (strain SPB074) TaxID=465543 RepID=UPI00017FE720|nr:VOC family protein [Streptomyces sp. SPB074]EDY42125.1 doxorubicin biosynthesis enzyme DnrV [Streptomyces sp. SPB074]